MPPSSASARASDRARVADIDTEILNLRRTTKRAISALKAEKLIITERLDSYKYPAFSLPNELISEIFIHFLPIYPRCPPLSGKHSPDALTRICRKWRAIALSTPALWRAISLEYDKVDMIKAWLHRSGRLPLSLQSDSHTCDEDEILEAIFFHRARWEHVSLEIHPTRLPVPSLEGPLPLLRELELHISAQPNTAIPLTFNEVPQLTTVTLWDFPYPTNLLPWSQLTSLTLIAESPAECTPVLQQTPGLVYCELILIGNHIPPSDIILPRLETLVVVLFGADGWGTSEGYLFNFVTPALHRLQAPDTFLGPDPISSLTSFITKSGCTLQEVCITGPRSESKRAYRTALPSIPMISFNEDLIDWYCREANAIRKMGTRSMADFESE
ncbi:hypothetical protein C8J57DRAFT_1725203 [Mycena rebaudengoi]|nr:hypothetical protein C8J57DRAFT_1725203 [Mycena rebaudengoi]